MVALLIQKKKTNALDILMKLEEKGDLKRLSLPEVKQLIIGKNTSQSFFKFADKLIADLKEAKRFGTAQSYQDVINRPLAKVKSGGICINKSGNKGHSKSKPAMTSIAVFQQLKHLAFGV